EPLAPFGDDPQPGAALYLGLTEPLPVGIDATLLITVAELDDADEERANLLSKEANREGCEVPPSLVDCDGAQSHRCGPANDSPLRHHSARTVWEYARVPDVWLPLDPGAGEIRDETRALTLNGPVQLRVPEPMAELAITRGGPVRTFLRCRLA